MYQWIGCLDSIAPAGNLIADDFTKRKKVQMSSRIRMQADDFFHAFQVLRESHHIATLAIMGPGIVCLAFSVELYIKDLYFALNMKPPRSHKILELYEKLPDQVRQEIFDHDAISQNPFATRGDIFSPTRFTSSYGAYDGFTDQIRAISDGFEKWRYSYESTAVQYEEWFALALIEAVKSAADSRRAPSAA